MFNLLVAETEEQKIAGMNDVSELPESEGMLFDYSDEPLASAEFTMENCGIPLDIIFVNQDGIVISVKRGDPYATEPIIEDSEFVSCVIELNVNSGVKPGDKTDLFNDIQTKEQSENEENSSSEETQIGNNELHVYGPDGEVQAVLNGGERIFSRHSSAILIKKAKLAYETKDDKDYKALGRYAFDEMRRQDGREPEYA